MDLQSGRRAVPELRRRGQRTPGWSLLTNLRRFSSGDPTGAPVIYRAADGTLTRISAPPQRLWEFASLAASPGGQLWMLASPGYNRNVALLFHWTGRKWTDAKLFRGLSPRSP